MKKKLQSESLKLKYRIGIFVYFYFLTCINNIAHGQALYGNPGCDVTTTNVVTLNPTAAWQTVSDANDGLNACKWYKITMIAGHKYTFKTGCGNGASCAGNSWLDLVGSLGNNVLTANDDANCGDPNPSSSELVFIPLTNDDYYLVVEEYSFGSMAYTLAYNVEDCNVLSDFTYSVNGNNVTFTDASTGSGIPATSWNWDFGDGGTNNTGTPPVHNYICAGDKQVTLITSDNNGCVSSKSYSINISGGVSASFTSVVDSNNVQFTNTSQPVGSIVSYNWDFGDGTSSSAPSPLTTFSCSGAHNIRLITTDNNGCKDTTYGQIYTTGAPQADFTVESIAGPNITFKDLSHHGANQTLTYLWNFDDGTPSSTQQNPSHSYACSGGYFVTLKVTQGLCTNETGKYIQVHGSLSPSFKYSGTGTTLSFIDISTSTTPITGVSWDFGDGTGVFHGTPTQNHTFTCAGNQYVTLTCTTATCTTSVWQDIQVTGDPKANFIYTIGPGPTTINLTSTSVGTSLTYYWSVYENNYPKGSYTYDTYNTPTVTHNFHCGGEKYVSLEVRNLLGCIDNTFQIIQITGDPNPDFNATPQVGNPNQINFSNGTTGTTNPNLTKWSFGDGQNSNQSAPFHNYTCPGLYTVTLEVEGLTNQCVVTKQKDIYINGSPKSNFAYSAGPGDTIHFQNTSIGTSLKYQWDFGDGFSDTIQNPAHSYECGGKKYVTLTVFSSSGTCQSDTTILIDVLKSPHASYSFDVNGNTINFHNTSMGVLTQTYWSFWNDDYSYYDWSSLPSPSKTITACGKINIEFYVSNGAGCYDEIYYDTLSLPYTSVTTSNDTLHASANGVTYQWINCSNNQPIAGAANQTYHPVASGNYSVIITTGTGPNVCSDTSVCVNIISIASPGAITGVTNTCQGQTGVIYSVSAISNATGYVWTLPSGATITAGSNTNSITVSFSGAATSGNVTVKGTNGSFTGPVSTFAVTVAPSVANAGTITGPTSITQGQTGITYTVPAIANATGYIWTLPPGATPATGTTTTTSPSITVNYSGSAADGNVTVQGSSAGCTGLVSAPLVIHVGTVGINQNDFAPSINVYPNPSNDKFILNTVGKGKLKITVTDVLGREVYSTEITANGPITHVIDLSGHANGSYTLKLQSENSRIVTTNLIKQ